MSLSLGRVGADRITTQRGVAKSKPRRWPESTPSPPLLARTFSGVVAEIEIHRRSVRARFAKRMLDLAGAVVGLTLLAPLFAVIAVLVRLTTRGPAFFVQERCGLGGKRFKFYKFRTMVVDAEERKADLQHLNEMRGPAFKIRRDPRITRLGALLRKLSLDELPQLLNVLKGDMSLVGPRPPLPEEVQRYTTRQAQRLAVTPGITGLWQVSGRNLIPDFEQWIDLDIQYVRSWSFQLDLRILAKTVVVVILARGAQ